MIADFHIHSSFSADSDAPMEEMIRRGISLGLSSMCFTEHMDRDFPNDPNHDFEVDTGTYYQEFLRLKDLFAGQMDLRFGIELGLQPLLADSLNILLKTIPFDFVIGSSHVVDVYVPYY